MYNGNSLVVQVMIQFECLIYLFSTLTIKLALIATAIVVLLKLIVKLFYYIAT